MSAFLLASGGEAPPKTVLPPLWEMIKDTSLAEKFGFNEVKDKQIILLC